MASKHTLTPPTYFQGSRHPNHRIYSTPLLNPMQIVNPRISFRDHVWNHTRVFVRITLSDRLHPGPEIMKQRRNVSACSDALPDTGRSHRCKRNVPEKIKKNVKKRKNVTKIKNVYKRWIKNVDVFQPTNLPHWTKTTPSKVTWCKPIR